jgi:hypothetical protein
MLNKKKTSKQSVPRLPKNYGIKRLIKNTPPTIDAISALTIQIGSFIKPVKLDSSERSKLREKVINNNRAKDDGATIARKKTIFVAGRPINQYQNGKLIKTNKLSPSTGCHPASLALYETLIALQKKFKIKINPKISRKRPNRNYLNQTFHSTVIFELNGKFWEADPFYSRIKNPIKEINSKDYHSRRCVPPIPIPYSAIPFEKFSKTAVSNLLNSNQTMD